jgi:hypothetical protein
LEEQLASAHQRLLEDPENDGNQGEFRCCQATVKIGQARLDVQRQKKQKALLEWRIHMNILQQKCRAQELVEHVFDSKDNADHNGESKIPAAHPFNFKFGCFHT